MSERTSSERSDSGLRRFRVRVVADGYAVVTDRTKKEATEKARAKDFAGTPRPDWYAQISDIREIGGSSS